MQMDRQRLPNRRRSITETIDFEGIEIDFSIGFSPDGSPLEVFGRMRKPGSTLDRLIDDTSVTISLALQSGVSIAQLGHSLGRLSDGSRSSVIGVIVDALESAVP